MPLHPPPLFRTIGALAACLPLISGCSLPAMMLGHFEPPGVTLSASKVESISIGTAVVRLVLLVSNPNGFGLRTGAVRYRLSLSGHVLTQGRSASSVTVPPHASATVEVHMEVPFTAVNDAAPDATMLGEIPYDLDGALLVGSFLSSREVAFAFSSTLRLDVPLDVASLPRLPSPPEAGTRTRVIDQ